MTNEILEKAMKAIMMNESYSPSVEDYVNALISTLQSIKPSNRTDASKISIAIEQAKKVRRHIKALEQGGNE